jgi:hypothetical protein
MQKEDGTFHDHLSYNNEYAEDNEPEKSLGIVLWSLGYFINNSPELRFQEMAKEIFNKALKKTINITSLNGIAYSILGLCSYMETFKIDQIAEERLFSLTDKLVSQYRNNSSDDWKWFEPEIKNESPVLPLAIISSSQLLQNDEHQKIAFESLSFLKDLVLKNEHLSLIGNNNSYKNGQERSVFNQLPVEVVGLIDLFRKAFEISGEKKYFKKMVLCFNWFFGKNDLYVNLYDSKTKGCYDGLQETGVNMNQSAESSLSFVISHLMVNEVKRKIKKARD